MLAHLHRIVRGLPSVLMMAAIFFFSSIPAAELPQLGIFDLVARKAAHMLGYGLLAVAFWYAFGWKQGRQKHAWLSAVLYARPASVVGGCGDFRCAGCLRRSVVGCKNSGTSQSPASR